MQDILDGLDLGSLFEGFDFEDIDLADLWEQIKAFLRALVGTIRVIMSF
ncbi:MAG: hypothetical protein FWF08_05060 [Oscillospiraceae bacterium]|nr:hypothetical protein [Oscillospiraceae bacterium]